MDKTVRAYSVSASEKFDNMSDPSIRHLKTTRVCLCVRADERAGRRVCACVHVGVRAWLTRPPAKSLSILYGICSHIQVAPLASPRRYQRRSPK